MRSEKSLSIAYYVSSHGYGHGVRSCNIIRAINKLYPQITVHVITRLPLEFLSSHIGSSRNPVRADSFDTGMVQLDSIRVDVEASLARIEELYSRREELVRKECAFLKDSSINLVVVDIPAIPLESAALLGIPRLAVGNFSWDWIYSEFVERDSRWISMVEIFREEYAKTDLLLRLPFYDAMSAFPRVEDIPLVASPGKARRDEIGRITGCDPAKKWILLSFTSLEWNDEALDRVEQIEDYEFLTILPLKWTRRNIRHLDRGQVSFSDVIASADVVVSKPGFGILSDCIVNRKPLIYADRKDFLEYAILEAAIRKHIKHVHIPAADLYRGDLRNSLDRIWKSPEPPLSLRHGGDQIAATRIAQFAGLQRLT